MSQLQIPDSIYKWIKSFFDEHYHCTRCAGNCPSVTDVKTSVIQGSELGLASSIVMAAELHLMTPTVLYLLVVLSVNSSRRIDEISHIEA